MWTLNKFIVNYHYNNLVWCWSCVQCTMGQHACKKLVKHLCLCLNIYVLILFCCVGVRDQRRRRKLTQNLFTQFLQLAIDLLGSFLCANYVHVHYPSGDIDWGYVQKEMLYITIYRIAHSMLTLHKTRTICNYFTFWRIAGEIVWNLLRTFSYNFLSPPSEGLV